jgi:hypothetical protein
LPSRYSIPVKKITPDIPPQYAACLDVNPVARMAATPPLEIWYQV